MFGRKHSDEHFCSLFETAPNGVIAVDAAGRIALLSAQAEKMFGYSRAELIGKPVEVLVPQRFRGGHAGLRKRAAANPRILAFGTEQPAQRVDAAYAAHQKRDYAVALRLVRPMAEQGDARAESLLGLIYLEGHGVQRDEAEAMKWYRRAADQGDADAQLEIGDMYYEGRGVAQDYSEAARWYRLAADRGNASAQSAPR